MPVNIETKIKKESIPIKEEKFPKLVKTKKKNRKREVKKKNKVVGVNNDNKILKKSIISLPGNFK